MAPWTAAGYNKALGERQRFAMVIHGSNVRCMWRVMTM
jgi:hypothetical protein